MLVLFFFFFNYRIYENFTASGVITSSAFISNNLCLHHDLLNVIMCNCLTANISHWFLLKRTQQLQSNRGLCLNVVLFDEINASKIKFKVILESCFSSIKQSWQRFGLQLQHKISGLCLELTVEYNLTVNTCRREAPMQYFIFEKEFEHL